MELSTQQRLMQMMSNEQVVMSDKLMKAMVERDEAVARYQKLLTSFAHLFDKCKYYRSELGISDSDWDYQIAEQSGILDIGEITTPPSKPSR